jgi:hypothetical protein
VDREIESSKVFKEVGIICKIKITFFNNSENNNTYILLTTFSNKTKVILGKLKPLLAFSQS